MKRWKIGVLCAIVACLCFALAGCQSEEYTPKGKDQAVSAAALGKDGTLRVGVNASSAPLAVKLVPFMLIGFAVYGPQALLGVATTQQATPRAAGVAGGFVGIFSYASTILSGLGFGYVAQRWGWNAAYATMFAAALAGAATLLFIWRAGCDASK